MDAGWRAVVGIGADRDSIEPAAENVSASVKVEVKGGGRERWRGRRRAGLKGFGNRRLEEVNVVARFYS